MAYSAPVNRAVISWARARTIEALVRGTCNCHVPFTGLHEVMVGSKDVWVRCKYCRSLVGLQVLDSRPDEYRVDPDCPFL